MNARPHRRFHARDLGARLDDPDARNTGELAVTRVGRMVTDDLVLQLDLFHPASVKGRTVLLRLNQQDREALLLALRRYAIEDRSEPEAPR